MEKSLSDYIIFGWAIIFWVAVLVWIVRRKKQNRGRVYVAPLIFIPFQYAAFLMAPAFEYLRAYLPWRRWRKNKDEIRSFLAKADDIETTKKAPRIEH